MKQKPDRNQEGFSLPIALSLGLIITLWVSALGASVLPTFHKIAAGKAQNALRATAESALDWAVSELNNPQNTLDDLTPDGSPGVYQTVSPSLLGSYGVPVVASVQVNNIAAPQTSYVYDPQLDPTSQQAPIGVAGGANWWRVVTATAKIPGETDNLGDKVRTIRVVMKPEVALVPQVTTTTTTSTINQNVFNFAMFARGLVNFNGNGTNTDSYDSSLGAYNANLGGGNFNRQSMSGDVGSNTAVNLGNGNVGGHLNVSSPVGNNGNVVTIGSNGHVQGGVQANGSVSNSGNVVGQGVTGDPVQQLLSNPQKSLPSAPSAPATATNLGAVSLSGKQTMTLTGGDYVMSSLSISGQGRLNINVPSGGTPVRIFVQGTSTATAISLGGNGVANNGKPANFQLYYNGTGSVSTAGNGSLSGVVYAPNAPVSLSGNGTVYGAVVGNTVTMNGGGSSGAFHYDRDLANANLLMAPTTITTTNTVTQLVTQRQRWMTVSWQEI